MVSHEGEIVWFKNLFYGDEVFLLLVLWLMIYNSVFTILFKQLRFQLKPLRKAKWRSFLYDRCDEIFHRTKSLILNFFWLVFTEIELKEQHCVYSQSRLPCIYKL